MNHINHSSKLLLLAIVMVFAFGCKSSKKLEASKAKEKARMEQEAALRRQQEEDARKRDAEEKARREAELKAKENEPRAVTPEARLSTYFKAIATAGNVASANTSINEALSLFATPETPVLIVISETGNQKDYDRPTTIKDYLHYLKDQKKNINTISNLKVDGTGKITEVELKKPL